VRISNKFCGLAAFFVLTIVATFVPIASTRAQQMNQSPVALHSEATVTGYTLSPGKLQASIDLARIGRELYFAEFAMSIVALLALLRLGVIAKFRDWAEAVSRFRIVQAAVFTFLLLLTLHIFFLPLHARGHMLVLHYNLSVQSWSSWLADNLKGELITIAIGALLAWVAFAFLRRSPRHWWIGVWCIAVPLTVAGAFLEPLVVEPMFYDFRPLAASHAELTRKIEEVSARAGVQIPPDRIYEMLASRKLNELNAYVTGIGASKRVVMWDTLLAKMNDDEALFVFGHELGHYVLGHVWKGIALGAISLAFGLWLLARVLGWSIAKWGAAFGIRGLADWPSLALLWLLASLLIFFSTPLTSAVSRYTEHQADQFGLEVIHGVVPDAPQVAAQSDQILGEVDLEEPEPSPLAVFWFYDHPPIATRIQFSLHYDPWSQGRAPEFIRH
jgi:Zn-dependent protease with chaperone function